MGLLYCYCTHLREIKRIVDDHLNIRVYQYIFLVSFTWFYIFLSFYNTLSARVSTQFQKEVVIPLFFKHQRLFV